MNNFAGLRVLALESRRAEEMAKLIGTYGGEPVIAPAMREVPLESNHEARDFVARLLKNEFEMVILLTGVGTRALTAIAQKVCTQEEFVGALQRVTLLARGPKPIAALRELGLKPAMTAPEPNTWREVLQTLDGATSGERLHLNGMRIAVQEYGVSNPELLAGLKERGAAVTRVPVYQWALPEDVEPLRAGIKLLVNGGIEVVLFTTGVQVSHLFEIAGEMKLEKSLLRSLEQTVVASIGPTTSEALQSRGVLRDLEPSHPKMGFLVKEAAEASTELLRRKRPSANAAQL